MTLESVGWIQGPWNSGSNSKRLFLQWSNTAATFDRNARPALRNRRGLGLFASTYTKVSPKEEKTVMKPAPVGRKDRLKVFQPEKFERLQHAKAKRRAMVRLKKARIGKRSFLNV